MPASNPCVARAPREQAISARFLLGEAAGSLGDLGTFLPIVVAMTQIVGLDPGTVLVFAGLMNVLTGAVFRIPIAVQPMKAVAALAIAGSMTATQVGVAGVTVGAAVLLLGALGLIGWLNRVIARPVLQGLQMAVAFQLLVAGGRLALYGSAGSVPRPLWGPEGLMVVAGALALTWLLYRRLRWAVLGLAALGLVGAALKEPGLLQGATVSLWRPRWALSDPGALAGMWVGALPQIPLTLLNSVLAVAMLAGHLFPDSRQRTTPTRMAISVGLMNLLTCPLGGMPLCHGSGGLAAQHRSGARSGLSMILLGAAKLIVGLLFGATALAWMQAFPSSVLGLFLLIAGAGLASASRCWATRAGLVAACVMIAVQIVTGALALGFLSGWLVYALLPNVDGQARAAREGRI